MPRKRTTKATTKPRAKKVSPAAETAPPEQPATDAPKPGRFGRVLLRIFLLIAVPSMVIAAAGFYWLQCARYVSTENAYVKTDIAKLAAEVSGKAVEVRAHAHMQVNEGDVLVKVDPRPFEIALSRAQAELDAARQEVETLRATLAEAHQELDEAQDRAAYYRKRYDRQKTLAKRGIIAETRGDELENDANAATDRVDMARQKIQRVMASLGGVPSRPVDEHPLVRAKIAAVEQAKLDLERTSVKAPSSGTVVTVPLVSGEQINASEPLFAIVTDKSPWVDANFKETELTHVRVGQTATIELDTYPGVTWRAKVKSISPATGAEFAILPPQNASGNWVKVVQRLPVRLELIDRAGAPPLRAGMTATVTIDTGRERTVDDLLGNLTALAKGRSPTPTDEAGIKK
ncbi:MAG: HlyD family secretion protein [Pseudomonadota bacterium]